MLDNLPPLPEGLFWSIEKYYGNSEDGVYAEGQAVLVSIRKHGKFMFWETKFMLEGTLALIADARLGEANIRDAVEKVYASYNAHLLGLKTTSEVI